MQPPHLAIDYEYDTDYTDNLIHLQENTLDEPGLHQLDKIDLVAHLASYTLEMEDQQEDSPENVPKK